MSNNIKSAFLGDPPNTDRDYYIIRGLYRLYGIEDADPNVGIPFFPQTPPGYVHEQKTTQILVGLVVIILVILSTTVPRVVLRASTPGMIFGSDDWAIIAAACCAILYPIFQILIIAVGGAGLHSWEVTYVQYDAFIHWGGVAIMIYYASVGLIKLSITLFLRRLVHQASKPWKIFCDVFLVTIVMYTLWCFSSFMHCMPIKSTWSTEYTGHLPHNRICLEKKVNAKWLSVIHVTQGVILLCSPIVMLWKTRMGLGKKIRLFSIWFAGAVTVLGGLLSMFLQTVSIDGTWDYTFIIAMAAMDICFGMLTASLPVLDAFIVDAWHKTTQRISDSIHMSKVETQDPQGGDSAVRSWKDTSAAGGGTASGVTSRVASSESQEHFVQNQAMETEMEMGILRTTDVEVRYSSASVSTLRTTTSIDGRVMDKDAKE